MKIHVKPIQYNDQIQCSFCGKAWDIKDQDPPECETKEQHNNRKMKELRGRIK